MACGRASLLPASTVALTIPSLMHVQMPDALTFFFQMLGLAIFSGALCPYYLPSNPAVPFLNGRYPASAVLRTTPPP